MEVLEMLVYRLQIFSLSLAIFALSLGCTGLALSPMQVGQNPNGTYNGPGSPKWWSKNKSRAEFVVGKGYRVPGVDGYYDDDGRSISQAVAPVIHKKSREDVLLGSLAPASTYAKLKTAIGQGPNANAAKAIFTEAERLFGQKSYAAAAEKYQAAAARWPGSELEQEALLKVGESYFFADKYADANDAYEALIKAYPGTVHLDKAIGRQWAIARYWQQMVEKNPDWPTTPNLTDGTRPTFDTLGRALKIYDNIRMNDPTGPWSDEALMATATSHFARGRYEDADYHFGLLRREYPKSNHQFEAHLLGLQCKLRKYQGPEYDPTSLEEAEKLVKQLRMQFGGQMTPEDRKRVDEIAGKIAKHRALRNWRMAQYYEKGAHYGAARIYYNRLAENYPETKLAESARVRLTKISSEPDTPEEHLGALIRMFPEDRERRAMNIAPVEGAVRR